MQVSKLDDGLVVRIPQSVADAMGLKEGDEVEARPAENGFNAEQILEEVQRRIRDLSFQFPAGFKFNRLEAHER